MDYAPAGYKSCFHGVIPKGDGLNLDSPGSRDEGHPFPASEGRGCPLLRPLLTTFATYLTVTIAYDI